VLEHSTVVPCAVAPALSPLVAALLVRARLPQVAAEPAAARELFLAATRVDRTPAALYAFAEWLSAREDWTGAVIQLELAWERAKLIGSATWRARCCHALADVQRQLGWLDLSRRYRQWAIAAELDSGRDPSVAAWLNDRMQDSLLAGEPDLAERWWSAAHAARDHESPQMAEWRFSRGVMHMHGGRWSQGTRCFIEAYHVAVREGELALAARAVLSIGHILRVREQWDRAVAAFCRAGRLFQTCGSESGQVAAAEFARECRRFRNVLAGDPRRN
jgi:hypothetical protein